MKREIDAQAECVKPEEDEVAGNEDATRLVKTEPPELEDEAGELSAKKDEAEELSAKEDEGEAEELAAKKDEDEELSAKKVEGEAEELAAKKDEDEELCAKKDEDEAEELAETEAKKDEDKEHDEHDQELADYVLSVGLASADSWAGTGESSGPEPASSDPYV